MYLIARIMLIFFSQRGSVKIYLGSSIEMDRNHPWWNSRLPLLWGVLYCLFNQLIAQVGSYLFCVSSVAPGWTKNLSTSTVSFPLCPRLLKCPRCGSSLCGNFSRSGTVSYPFRCQRYLALSMCSVRCFKWTIAQILLFGFGVSFFVWYGRGLGLQRKKGTWILVVPLLDTLSWSLPRGRVHRGPQSCPVKSEGGLDLGGQRQCSPCKHCVTTHLAGGQTALLNTALCPRVIRRGLRVTSRYFPCGLRQLLLVVNSK